jgi:hypothetical protein
VTASKSRPSAGPSHQARQRTASLPIPINRNFPDVGFSHAEIAAAADVSQAGRRHDRLVKVIEQRDIREYGSPIAKRPRVAADAPPNFLISVRLNFDTG